MNKTRVVYNDETLSFKALFAVIKVGSLYWSCMFLYSLHINIVFY